MTIRQSRPRSVQYLEHFVARPARHLSVEEDDVQAVVGEFEGLVPVVGSLNVVVRVEPVRAEVGDGARSSSTKILSGPVRCCHRPDASLRSGSVPESYVPVVYRYRP